jgi:hypothetical protein
MEIRPSLVYILAFFSLAFLLHECYDWAHVLAGGAFCHCWGPRAFDSWALCRKCVITDGHVIALIYIVGPLLSYTLIWIGYRLMHPDNMLERRSVGFSLLFAALPLTRIMGAFSSTCDETWSLRQMIPVTDLTHHRLVAIVGLLIVLILTLPPLIRAFLLLPGWIGKLLVFPAFLLLPPLIDRLVVHKGMNHLLTIGILDHRVITGLPFLVLAWLFFTAIVFLMTCRSLPSLLDYPDEWL